MRLPWQRREPEETADEGGEDMSWRHDDERDDELDEEAGEGGTGESEAEDELADLGDEERARVEAYAAKREAAAVAARTTEWRTRFQERGFDLTPEGQPLIADAEKVAAFTGTLRPAPVKPSVAEGGVVEEDPKPDMYADPEGYERWAERRADKRAEALFEKRFAELAPRLEASERFQMSVAERQAMERVQEIIPNSAFSQVGAPEYREAFTREFLAILRGTPKEVWAEDEVLEQMAAATIPKVLPRKAKQRDEAGRYASPRGVNARAYDDSWQGYPDAGRPPRRQEASDEEKRAMRQFNMTPDELVGLSGPAVSIADYRAAQKKQKK